jgi:transcriptional regulator with AAA-type ATPase domain
MFTVFIKHTYNSLGDSTNFCFKSQLRSFYIAKQHIKNHSQKKASMTWVALLNGGGWGRSDASDQQGRKRLHTFIGASNSLQMMTNHKLFM